MVYINIITCVFSAQGVLRRPVKSYNLSDKRIQRVRPPSLTTKHKCGIISLQPPIGVELNFFHHLMNKGMRIIKKTCYFLNKTANKKQLIKTKFRHCKQIWCNYCQSNISHSDFYFCTTFLTVILFGTTFLIVIK